MTQAWAANQMDNEMVITPLDLASITPQLQRYAQDLAALFEDNRQLRRDLERHRQVVRALADSPQGIALFETTPEGRVSRLNSQAAAWLGVRAEAVTGFFLEVLLGGEPDSGIRSLLTEAMSSASRQLIQGAIRLRREDDQENLPVMLTPLGSAADRALFWLVQLPDGSPDSLLEAHVNSTLYMALPQAIMVTDPQGRILAVNPAFSETTGWTAEEIRGQTPALMKSGRHDEAYYQALWQRLNAQDHWEGEIWNRRKNGEIYPEWLSIRAIRGDDGHLLGYVATFSDLTGDKRLDEELYRLAHYDPLTGLANRLLFQDRLAHALAAPPPGQAAALLYLDLDRFKDVNDRLGHRFGDLLLTAAGQRMRAAAGPESLVARLGGDEFAVLLAGDETGIEAEARALAAELARLLGSPFEIEGRLLLVGASIGIALAPRHADTPVNLIHRADLAMYQAKQERGGHVMYAPELEDRRKRRESLGQDLRAAIADTAMQLRYQPRFEADGQRLAGIEALSRWHHPEHGWITPSHFIALSEDEGHIHALGKWVIQEACRQHAAWLTAGLPAVPLAVNISPRELARPDFTDHLAAALRQHDLPARLFGLEITTGRGQDSLSGLEPCLRRIAALGVELTLDDAVDSPFSLRELKTLGIRRLGIDTALVARLPDDPEAIALTHALCGLGSALQLELVAKGVETPAQRAALAHLPRLQLQGNLYAPPQTAEDLFHRFATTSPSSS